jgi:hypothetical protein
MSKEELTRTQKVDTTKEYLAGLDYDEALRIIDMGLIATAMREMVRLVPAVHDARLALVRCNKRTGGDCEALESAYHDVFNDSWDTMYVFSGWPKRKETIRFFFFFFFF